MNIFRCAFVWATIPVLAAAATGKRTNGHEQLRIVMVDAEGGAASLFVDPHGHSLLVDTGWGSNSPPARAAPNGTPAPGLDPHPPTADRIVAAAKRLGLHRIDYVLITHYHADHVGGVIDLLGKISVGTFIDHGPNREAPGPVETSYQRYVAATAGHRRRSVKPGETLALGSLVLTFVASDGALIAKPLAGAGGPTAQCDTPDKQPALGGEENDRSLGFMARYGVTRILDLGDLTWNKEKALVCPVNELGHVDLLLVSHHGSQYSNSPPLIDATASRVALMANGARKGGDSAVFETLANSEHKPVLWQEHAATRSPQSDRPEQYIANPDVMPDGNHDLDVLIETDGRMQVTNTRNGHTESYPARLR
ncbi:MAG: ComEC/Rec2 family competence protein [Steroidobacteraceae bacterium]